MDRGFEILDHTSELKIRAVGRTKEEVFLNMMRGMMAVLRAKTRNSSLDSARDKIRNIKIESQDIHALLVDFLNEILYLTEVHREVYHNVIFKKFSDTELEGKIMGEKAASFEDTIKAVTYHGVHVIIDRKGLYGATVIFDV